MSKITARLEDFRADAQKEWSCLNGKLGGVLKDLDKIELNPTTEHLFAH